MDHAGHDMSHHNHAHHNMPGMESDPGASHAGMAMASESGMGAQPMNHSMMDMMMGGMMKMYFHFDAKETVLFKTWMTHTAAQMFGTCLFCIILGILYEGIKVTRDRVRQRQTYRRVCVCNPCKCKKCKHKVGTTGQKNSINSAVQVATYGTNAGTDAANGDAESETTCQGVLVMTSDKKGFGPFTVSHVLDTLLQFVQLTFSYVLMLLAMTYNVWLFFAVIVGCSIGYFSFGWMRKSDSDSVAQEDCCG